MGYIEDELTKIKAKEAEIREALARGDAEVFVPRQFTDRQLGLSDLVCDQFGHIWRRSDFHTLVRVYPGITPAEGAAKSQEVQDFGREAAQMLGWLEKSRKAVDDARRNEEFAKMAREDGLAPCPNYEPPLNGA